MSETAEELLRDSMNLAERGLAIMKLMDADYKALASRYDDAMKRIQDMQAELEYLRQEVNRG